jgi:hypothetical protein
MSSHKADAPVLTLRLFATPPPGLPGRKCVLTPEQPALQTLCVTTQLASVGRCLPPGKTTLDRGKPGRGEETGRLRGGSGLDTGSHAGKPGKLNLGSKG